MSLQRRYSLLLGLLLIVIFGVFGTVIVTLQSTSNSPDPLPTLAQVADANTSTESQSNDDTDTVIQTTDRVPSIVPDSTINDLPTVNDTIDVPAEPVINQYILELSEDTRPEALAELVADLDIDIVETIDELNRVVILADETAVAQLTSAAVLSAEPDHYASALITLPPGDPMYPIQWALDMIGAPDAWRHLPDDLPTIRVAVLDSGICADHPDMQVAYSTFQRDYVQKDNNPQDEFGHGCSVAGVIASQNNNIGLIGVAPFVEIMPLRVLGADGIGKYSHIAQAVIDATNNGAHIINLSLGGYNNSSTLRSAINYALANDVYVVAATGNDGRSNPLYPAAFDGVIAVGSVDQAGTISTFSNRGEDTLAPGELIAVPYIGDTYVYQSGTSFAAPHVSGVIALELALGQVPVFNGQIIHVDTDNIPTQIPPTPVATETPAFITVNGRTIPNLGQLDEPEKTDRWAVRLQDNVDATALANELGFQNLGQVGELKNYYVFVQDGSGASEAMALNATQVLSESSAILEFVQEVRRKPVLYALPGDPLVDEQWHLKNTGQSGGTSGNDINVEGAWDAGYTGTDITVASVDDGLDITHPDFVAKYNASASRDFNGSDTTSETDWDANPSHEPDDTGHGTSVSGVAAADDDGTTCGVGVAYNADLAAIRLIGSGHFIVDSQIADALNFQMQTNDIYNNSWGFWSFPPSPLGPLTNVALLNGITNGRGGKGNIYVWSAGNDAEVFDHANADNFATSRYTIAVGATGHDGERSPYSEMGVNLLVNAPSNIASSLDPDLDEGGIVTSDRQGTAGSNNTSGFSDNCTDSFSGTSAAAPMVSGVIALMLDANPDLTWRDVQHILVESARKNDPTDSLWNTNGAGHDFNIQYGFGTVDAAAAVALAETWTNVEPEISYQSNTIPVSTSIPDGSGIFSTNTPIGGDPVQSQIIIGESIKIESVEVYLNATHTYWGDLVFFLTSPSGTTSYIYPTRRIDSSSGVFIWTVSSMEFWGEESAGVWTLTVQDVWPSDTGQVNEWAINFNGTQGRKFLVNTTNDVNDGTCNGSSCSLREAIIAANAYGDGALVSVPSGHYNLSIAGTGEDAAATGDLDITSDIRIVGAGRDETIIDANSIDRVFDISAPAIIEKLAITGGVAPSGENGGGIHISNGITENVSFANIAIYDNTTSLNGGGIYIPSGSPDIRNSEIYQNSATNGGGIYLDNTTLRLAYLYIHHNDASANGGGVYLYSPSPYYSSLRKLTVADNTANNGGGIYLTGADYQLMNLTLSGNVANVHGGGAYIADHTAMIYYSTFANNTADGDNSGTGDGGGVYIADGLFIPKSTIIANNLDLSTEAPDCFTNGSSELQSSNNNVIGDISGCDNIDYLSDQTADDILFLERDYIGFDPQLGALTDNGGRTPTRAIAPGSVAVDRGSVGICDAVFRYDQRSLARDSLCDIGAYEFTGTYDNPLLLLDSFSFWDGNLESISTERFNRTYYWGNNTFVTPTVHTIILGFNQPLFDPVGSVAVADASNLQNYQLVSAGTDGMLESTNCNVSGDDTTVALQDILVNNMSSEVYLLAEEAQLLPVGEYRFMVCDLQADNGVLLDGNRDGIGGDAVSYDFSVLSAEPTHVELLTAPDPDVLGDYDHQLSTNFIPEVTFGYDYPLDTIYVTFTNSVNSTQANDTGNYLIVEAGTDGILQTDSCTVQGDDQVIPLGNVTYSDPQTTITPQSSLTDGLYRVIVCDGIEDLNGDAIDGDYDNEPGGNHIGQFVLFPKPLNVEVSSGTGGALITWEDINTSETGFGIWRKTTDGYLKEIGTVGANVTSFVDGSAVCGTEYTYRLQSRRDTDLTWSGYSPEVTTTIDCNTGTFLVNSTTDTNDGVCDGVSCSLREAIIAANAYGDGAIVSVPSGHYNLSIAGTGEDAAATGDLDVIANVHVVGAGRDQTIIDANQIDRVFDFLSPMTSITDTSIERVTITGGLPENGANGGGIRFMTDYHGRLAIIDSEITNNHTTGNGGGIASQTDSSYIDSVSIVLGIHGTDINNNSSAVNGGGVFSNNSYTAIMDSDIGYNTALENGGGMFITEHASSQVIYSVVHHNEAARGGGGYFLGFPNGASSDDVFAQFFNSTISNNSALSDGGGIVTQNQTRSFLRYSTITENIADADNDGDGDGGGFFFDDVTDVNINSTMSLILYDNVDLSGEANDCASEPLVTINARTTGMFPEMEDCVISGEASYIGVDPMLGALSDNGGATLTHSIPESNPARDTGYFSPFYNFHYFLDARGQMRNPWGLIDAGSYEYTGSSINELPELVNIGLNPLAYQDPYSSNFALYGYDLLEPRLDFQTVQVYFDELLSNPTGNHIAHDATNPDNYLLVEQGGDSSFSTVTCDTLAGDDVAINFISDLLVDYQPVKKTTIILESVLPPGEYRLIVCNLRDLNGQTLDGNHDGVGGDPAIFDFGFDSSSPHVTVSSPTAYSNFNRLPTQQTTLIREAISSLNISLSSPKNPAGDSDPNDITNTDNYLLVAAGANEVFNTSTCGIANGDDPSIPLTSISQISTSSFDINFASTIGDGLYRLIVCNLQTSDDIDVDGDFDYRQGGDYIGDFMIFPHPTNLTGTIVGGQIDLTWDDNSSTETKYVVERRTPDTGWFVISETNSDVNSFSDTNTVCNGSYIYRVYAYRESDTTHSGYSEELPVDIECAPMIDPDNLIATAISSTQIDLTWNDNEATESTYRVERRESGGVFAEIAELPASTASYPDTTVVCGTDYEYQVRAYRAIDTSFTNYTNIAAITSTPCSPLTLAVEPIIGQEQLNLSWVDNSDDETEFLILRSISATGVFTQVSSTAAANITSFNDTGLNCYTEYFYQVQAYRSGDDQTSEPSTIASAETSCTVVTAPDSLAVDVNEEVLGLTWIDNSPDETSFEIQRAISGSGSWSTVGSADSNITTFTDTTTVCGGEYDYRVRAYRAGDTNYSDFTNISNIRQICPPPAAPSDLTLTALPFSNDIQLDWTDHSTTETDFYIERSTDGAVWIPLTTVSEDVTTYTDTDASLACYTPYYYQVRAYRDADEVYSDYSAMVVTSTWCDVASVPSIYTPFSITVGLSDISNVTGFPQPSCVSDMDYAYVWEVPQIAPDSLTYSTFGSTIDTVISFWKVDGDSMSEVGCNDNAKSDGTSALVASFPIDSNEYVLIVGGKNGASGSVDLNSDFVLAPTATPEPTSTPIPTPTGMPDLATVGLYRDGVWFFRDSNESGNADVTIRFGMNLNQDWQPVIGDWNGDGIDGFGLYRDGRWVLRDVIEDGRSIDYQFVFGFVEHGWQPVVGDWDGDGDDGIGVYKDGIWLLKNETERGDADFQFRFNPSGDAGAIPVAGDWHDEARDRVGLYLNGRWYLSREHQTRSGALVFDFGPSDGSWSPIVGDWDEDGDDTIGVFKDGGWRFRNSNSRGNPDFGMTFGLNGGTPIAGYRGDGGALALLASLPEPAPGADPAPVVPSMTATMDSVTDVPETGETATPVPSEMPMDTATALPTMTATWTLTWTPTVTATETALPTATLTPSPMPTDAPLEVPVNTSGT